MSSSFFFSFFTDSKFSRKWEAVTKNAVVTSSRLELKLTYLASSWILYLEMLEMFLHRDPIRVMSSRIDHPGFGGRLL